MPAKTLRDMIEMLFDVETMAVESTVTVSFNQPPTLIARNNPNRLSLIISNPSARNIYVKFDKDFVVGEGILLVPNGGFLAFTWDEDFDVVGWEMNGIAEVANGTINVLEIVTG